MASSSFKPNITLNIINITNHNVIIILCLFLLMLITCPDCVSLRFEIQSGYTKCISEDIKRDAMTVGKYTVVESVESQALRESHRITARVTSPRGNNYHYGDSVETGTFAFTAAETGDYMTCFWAPYNNPPIWISIDFEWKTGIDAKDWYNVARKGQIDLLDVELRRLYETVKFVHDEMFYLREREEEMQKLNRSTNSKMAFFMFISLVISMCVAVLQLWHLKGYFERKKLL